MPSKAVMVAAIKAAAESTQNKYVRLAIGETGAHLDIGTGEKLETGQAWLNLPTVWDTVIEGISSSFGVIRQTLINTSVIPTDSIIEIADDNVTVSLPAPSSTIQGSYIIKALNVINPNVSGTVDGIPGLHGLIPYESYRVYCNGTQWLSW